MSWWRVLIPVWLVTAIWDGLCASALSVMAYDTPASTLWRGVATALPGSASFDGSAGVLVGLSLHALVALLWSTVFVVAAWQWPALRRVLTRRAGALGVAVAYGPFIWLMMSVVVIPLATGRPPRVGGARWWVQFAAHVPFVTLPLVLTARRQLMSAAKNV